MSKTGCKMLLLVLSGTGLFFIQDIVLMSVCLGLVFTLYLMNNINMRVIWQQIRPVLTFLGVLFVAQGIFVSWGSASIMALRFVTLILLAAWVTLTTPVSLMISTLMRMLRPFSKDAYQISFALLLTWRFIPIVARIMYESKEARLARTSASNNSHGWKQKIKLWKRFCHFRTDTTHTIVPVIVRTLSTADSITEALNARGFESNRSE